MKSFGYVVLRDLGYIANYVYVPITNRLVPLRIVWFHYGPSGTTADITNGYVCITNDSGSLRTVRFYYGRFRFHHGRLILLRIFWFHHIIIICRVQNPNLEAVHGGWVSVADRGETGGERVRVDDGDKSVRQERYIAIILRVIQLYRIRIK